MEIYLAMEMIEEDEGIDFNFKAFKNLEDAKKFIENNPAKNLYLVPIGLE